MQDRTAPLVNERSIPILTKLFRLFYVLLNIQTTRLQEGSWTCFIIIVFTYPCINIFLLLKFTLYKTTKRLIISLLLI